MESEERYIEELMKQLYTDDARSWLILHLVKWGRTVPKDGIDKAAEYFENIGMFLSAAEIAEKKGMDERTIRLYEMAMRKYERLREFHDAAIVAKRLGREDEAWKFYKKAVEQYSREGKASMVNIISKDMGFTHIEEVRRRILEEYEKKGDFNDAIRSAESFGLYDRVELYERVCKLIRGEEEDSEELLKQLYTDGGRANVVLQLLRRGKEVPKNFIDIAIEYYKSKFFDEPYDHDFELAIEIAEKIGMGDREKGMDERIIELYEMAIRRFVRRNLFGDAAEIAKKLGREDEARKLYERGIEHCYNFGHFVESVKLFEKVEPTKYIQELGIKIMEKLDEMGRFDGAAIVANSLRMKDRAELYERVCKLILGEEEDSEELLKQLYTDGGRANVVLQLLRRGKEVPKNFIDIAIEYFEKTDHCYNSNDRLAAKIAEKAGMKDRAREIRLRKMEMYEKKGDFMNAACIAEELGMEDRARELYERKIEKYEKMEWYEDAAEIAKKLGREDKIKELDIKIRDKYRRLAEEYERSGKFGDAETYAKLAGMKERAELYRRIHELIRNGIYHE